jgi:hypothetical protein
MTFFHTLVAFLLGGVVTLTTQLILEARRESRSRIQRDEETETETKMAARLIVLDLISMLALLKAARQTGRWWNALQLPATAWDSHSEALSRVLSDEVWRTVGSTFAGAAAWNDLVLGARRYYWVMPRLNLRRLGLVEMHDALREGAAEGLHSLLPIALPTIGEDDPLQDLAKAALEPPAWMDTPEGAPSRRRGVVSGDMTFRSQHSEALG